MIHKCKQRLTRLTQVAITERRMALEEHERQYVLVAPKVRRREVNRERKALLAARIEKAIEKELLERLKLGAYGDKPLNVDENVWKRVMGKMDTEQEEEFDEDDDANLILDDESDVGEVEYVEDSGDEDELVDVEDLEKWLGEESNADDDDDSDNEAQKPKKKRARVEIEYEEEPTMLTNIAK